MDASIKISNGNGINIINVHELFFMRAQMIAEIAGKTAANIIVAAFGGNIHNTRHCLAIFRIKSAANHLEFLHHVFIDIDYCPTIIYIGYRYAVYPVTDLATSATANVQSSAGILYQTRL